MGGLAFRDVLGISPITLRIETNDIYPQWKLRINRTRNTVTDRQIRHEVLMRDVRKYGTIYAIPVGMRVVLILPFPGNIFVLVSRGADVMIATLRGDYSHDISESPADWETQHFNIWIIASVSYYFT